MTFTIDIHGFRETTSLDAAQVFALGDSFVFGYGTVQDKTWVEQLEQLKKIPLYNLGVSATGPKSHYLLLKYLLETKKPTINIKKCFCG